MSGTAVIHAEVEEALALLVVVGRAEVTNTELEDMASNEEKGDGFSKILVDCIYSPRPSVVPRRNTVSARSVQVRAALATAAAAW